jgi:hypothetical protein
VKKFTVLASTLSLSLLAVALAACEPKATTGVDNKDNETPATMTEAQYVERGRYIANTSECLACHTPIRPLTSDGTPTGTPINDPNGNQIVAPDFEHATLAGGNAWLTPGMGVGISPNLTPYPGSDIATLTVDELADKWKAIKDGQLLPPMPGLAKYELEDLKALAYYFKSVPAQAAQPPAKYDFKGKSAGDKTWPVPGWMKLETLGGQPNPGYVGADHTGGVIPGMLETSVAPFSNGAYGQALIDANIGVANGGGGH